MIIISIVWVHCNHTNLILHDPLQCHHSQPLKKGDATRLASVWFEFDF